MPAFCSMPSLFVSYFLLSLNLLTVTDPYPGPGFTAARFLFLYKFQFLLDNHPMVSIDDFNENRKLTVEDS